MQVLFSKTNTPHADITADTPRSGTSFRKQPAKRALSWKPQPSGLTRDETRQAVLDMIG